MWRSTITKEPYELGRFSTVWVFYGNSLSTILNIPVRIDVIYHLESIDVIYHLESSHATEVIPHFNIGACTGETTPFDDKSLGLFKKCIFEFWDPGHWEDCL